MIYHYQWSPAGDQLAFIADGMTEENIYLVNTDGNGLRNLTNISTAGQSGGVLAGMNLSSNQFGGTLEFSWSPDGMQIAFETTGSRIFVVHLESGEIWEVTGGELPNGHKPLWTPDGQWIAFQYDGLWLSRPYGSERIRLDPEYGWAGPRSFRPIPQEPDD
jgi:Tol biopolymer transport system component